MGSPENVAFFGAISPRSYLFRCSVPAATSDQAFSRTRAHRHLEGYSKLRIIEPQKIRSTTLRCWEGTYMKTTCELCGSENIIPEVRILDQGEYSNGKLQVVVCGNPDAFIFKDRMMGELKAHVCGECGHTELKVMNPKELYRKYRESLK